MSIHSHVQLPYSILKRFRDETTAEKKVWYLDISSGRIMQKEARKLGTSKGYYSECGEAFWNKVVEDSLAKLNHKIWNFSQGKTPFPDITPEDKKTARRYIKAAVERSGMADEAMKQSSATAKLHSEQANHDALSAFGMNSVGEFDQILERLDGTVLLNCTDRDLVVPRNCFYVGASSCGLNIVAPIFPKGALLLFEPEKNPEWVNRGVAVTDPDQVIALNRSALKYEYFYHGSFVASNSRLELEQLQLFQQAYRAELEAFRCG